MISALVALLSLLTPQPRCTRQINPLGRGGRQHKAHTLRPSAKSRNGIARIYRIDAVFAMSKLTGLAWIEAIATIVGR